MAEAKKKKIAAKAPAKKAATQKKKVAPKAAVVVETPVIKTAAPKKAEKMSEKEAAPIFGKGKSVCTVGKRKRAIVRIRLFLTGDGKIQVNKRPFQDYFKSESLQECALMPLEMTNNLKSFDVNVVANGGGISAQAQAMRHGLARALIIIDKELKKGLKKATLLTRDARIKERKKYGLHRARRGPQFSKR